MSHIRSIYSILDLKERRCALWLVCLMVIGMVMETLGIGLIVPAIALFLDDNISDSYPSFRPFLKMMGDPDRQSLLGIGMFTLVIVYLVKTMYLAFLIVQQNRFNNRVQVHLSQRLFTLYLRQPYKFHLQRNSAQLIRNIANEVGYFLSTGLTSTMTLITEFLVLFGIVTLLLVIEPYGTIGIVVVVGASCIMFQRITKSRVVRWGAERQLHDGLRIQQVQQGLGGAKDVKLLGREKDFLDQYAIHNAKTAKACVNLSILQAMPRLWLELMTVIGLATIVLIMVSQGKDPAKVVSVLGLFAAAAFRLMPSVTKIMVAAQSVRFGDSAVKMLREELRLEIPAEQKKSEPWELVGQISIKDVSFSYPDSVIPAVANLSLEIHRGETVGIIGASGSGKSSLVDLILGLYFPESGKILIDDRDMLEDLRGWQSQLGYVPQAIFLTDDSLRRNIAFGLAADQIDERAVERAMRDARLDDFIHSLPHGLDTIVGERGVRLSGGQRQRIGIARALYHDPNVIILDEATSALDGETESEVMDAINALRGKKTVVIVAHRLSTLESCDRIFRMDHGKLVETGTPDEVLRRISNIEVNNPLDLGLI